MNILEQSKNEEFVKEQFIKGRILDDTKDYGRTQFVDEIYKLQQENKQLKEKLDCDLQWAFKYEKQVDNWNKLKKWLEKELGDRINPNKDKWLTGVYDAYRETIDKMQELEQGSDNQ